MKFLMLTLFTVSLFSSSAFAYRDTTYSCKNSNPELPNNTYKIETVRLGSASLPYLEVTRYTKQAGGGVGALTAKGLASLHSLKPDSEIIKLGALSIEIVNGEMVNCKQ